MHRLLLITALAIFPSMSNAQDLCGRLSLPDGYGLICTLQNDGAALVQPTGGVFSALSKLELRSLDAKTDERAFDDPGGWLLDQSGLDLASLKDGMKTLGSTDPDNPLGGNMLKGIADSVLAAIDDLHDVSRAACGAPNVKNDVKTDLSCHHEFGPMRYLVFSRVIAIGDDRYALRAQTMNDKRLTHFKAIINSFD